MKLNNRGWGLGVFLLFLLMFFIMLMIVANLIGSINDRFVEENKIILIK
ncbi:MAG: hypothetical protein IJN90_05460 [Bacilli bacterium]|nr:hypothetical protein [Bacilli bacterium]